MSSAENIVARCRELARISDVPGQTTRTFLSPATREAHALVSGWMESAGLHVRTDAIGNLRGMTQAAQAGAPRLLIGSHLDTVKDAGPFDGPLGVVIGIALADAMQEEGQLPFALEVIGFSEEEGVRFAKPFLGSLAAVGELGDSLLDVQDETGMTVRDAVADFGLDWRHLKDAQLDPATFGYLEFHVEQGPVLDEEGIPVGVVEAIAGQTRLQVIFRGRANHAGTTPMGRLRQDALAAAAQWIVEVERDASECAGLLATVGKLDVPAAAANVIPGECLSTLDVRHANDNVRTAAVERLLRAAQTAGASRRVVAESRILLEQPAVAMDPELTKALIVACEQAKQTPSRRMVSGAGHDAMILARRVPAAMLFLRSPGGLSHHPDESVTVEDVDAAFRVGLEFLRALRDDRAMLDRLVECAREYRREVSGA